MRLLISCVLFSLFMFSSCRKNDQVIPEDQLLGLEILPDSIMLNPLGNAPLVASVHFKSPVNGVATITVKGKHGDSSDVVHTFNGSADNFALLVAGLYPDYKNEVRIEVMEAGGRKAVATTYIQTAPLSPLMPAQIAVDVANRKGMEPGMNLVSSFSGFPDRGFMPYMVDSYGDIRWVLDITSDPGLKKLNYECGIARLNNGNFYFADANSARIYEVDLAGTILNRWEFPGYIFHHNVSEKVNGNFLLSVSKPGSVNLDGVYTIEDYIIEVDRHGGGIITVWDLKESLDERRTALQTDLQDWMHVNAVIEDPTDNTIIVSGRTQGIVKLGYDNSVRWIMSTHRGWTVNRKGQNLQQFLLQPLDHQGIPITNPQVSDGAVNHPDFEWNWYQHSPVLMPDHSLLIFDNGTTRNYETENTLKYSRAVQYVIDEANKTIRQKWTYGKERGAETYSSIISSVKYNPVKNTILFSPGYFVPNPAGAGGRVVEVEYSTKSVVFEMGISAAKKYEFHRVERLSLY